jgi:hypothetical protein
LPKAAQCTCTNWWSAHATQVVLIHWSVSTLLLTVVAIMASQASVLAAGLAQGLRCLATRFVCAKCTETGQLSSRGLFLSQAAVRRHLAASKPCFTANLGFREIQVDFKTSDVMDGAGGTVGPAPDQPEKKKVPRVESVLHSVCIPCKNYPYHQGVYAHCVVV